MKFYWSLILLLVLTPNFAHAEGGCPPGQYPIGGQGAVACAPMPQDNSQPKARALGKWIKTWGAIAMGSIDSVINYGVSTGKFSKSEARDEAMAKCASHGEKDCKVTLTYFNQCAAISTPEIDGKPLGGGWYNSQEVPQLRRHQPAHPHCVEIPINHLLSALSFIAIALNRYSRNFKEKLPVSRRVFSS